MKAGYHLNSFETKASLRERLAEIERYNLNLAQEAFTQQNELSQLRSDTRRMQTKLTSQATMLDELTGQVRVQANIVTSANLAKQEALKQYQAAYQRANDCQKEIYRLRDELVAAREPRSLFDRIFGRD